MTSFVDFATGAPVVLACPACGPVPAGAIAVECTAHAEDKLGAAYRLGREAHAADAPAAPAVNPEIMAMVAGLPVGAGAVDVFAAFAAGYEFARAQELAALGF